MVMQVLHDTLQLSRARQQLIEKGASVIRSPLGAFLRQIGVLGDITVGDTLKSWDVLSTINFIEARVRTHEPILDIGCFASEVIVALYKLGYTNLTGIDLNPSICQMPHREFIRYVTGNFKHTPFDDASFKAITSISVMEHGFDGEALLKEMARLLKPGGYFIASFDYWPEKIDTSGVSFFGMEWTIFSRQDVVAFIEQAAGYGLAPVGELHYDGQETPIECVGYKYTFAWLALARKN